MDYNVFWMFDNSRQVGRFVAPLNIFQDGLSPRRAVSFSPTFSYRRPAGSIKNRYLRVATKLL